jgi:hypothetical protein
MVLNSSSVTFKGLSKSELKAWHEVLSWLRQPGNNQWITGYMTTYEGLSDHWRRLGVEISRRLQTTLPEADKRMQITFMPKFGRNVATGELGDTLGDEPVGLVQVETNAHGRPRSMQSYNALKELGRFDQVRRVAEVRLPTADGKAWRAQSQATLDLAEVAPNLCQDLATGAEFLVEQTWVQVGDAHWDAKAHPCIHPCPTVIMCEVVFVNLSVTFAACCAHPNGAQWLRLVWSTFLQQNIFD